MNENTKKIIEGKLNEAEKQFDKDRITVIEKAIDVIKNGKDLPPPEQLFGNFIFKGELTIIAGDPGTGKSALIVQLADAITKSKKELLGQKIESCNDRILYYDFELSDYQFVNRYRACSFDPKFFRSTLNYKAINIDQINFEDIKYDLEETDAKIFILDNITALSLKSAEDTNVALEIMKGLLQLSRSGFTIIVLAHIPKTIYGRALNINSLAGSKALANLADSIFFIAKSRKREELRYLKRVKQRSCQDQKEVLVLELLKDENQGLHFEFLEYSDESEHIYHGLYDTAEEKEKLEQQVLILREKGYSIRQIAKELGISKSKVERLLKKNK
jgi:predicted ATP-dependent serine protease